MTDRAPFFPVAALFSSANWKPRRLLTGWARTNGRPAQKASWQSLPFRRVTAVEQQRWRRAQPSSKHRKQSAATDAKGHRLVARLIVVGESVKTTHASRDWLKRVFGHNACGQLAVELSQIVARRRHKHALDALSKVSPKVPDVAGNEMRGPRRHRSQKDGHILVGQSQVLGKTT